jgi:hypothetical protein
MIKRAIKETATIPNLQQVRLRFKHSVQSLKTFLRISLLKYVRLILYQFAEDREVVFIGVL